jgi:uncharacterized protein
MELVYFLILGVLAGILSGLFGIGGGIIMVPSLIAIFGMDILNANATSLTAMLLPVGIFGVIAYYKAGLVNLKESLWISLGLFAGSFLGGEIAINLNESVLSKLYGGFLMYIAFTYFDVFKLIKAYFQSKKGNQTLSTNASRSENKKHKAIEFILVGIAAGIFAGMFGKGGGIIIVPLLISLFHYEGKKAVATSLTSLQLPVGLPSVLIYAEQGYVHIASAALIATGMLIGALAGSKIGIKLPAATFKKVFAVFLICMSVYMLVGYINH